MDLTQLLSRLGSSEDNYVERKPANVNRREIRKTVVAFANSTPEGRSAVLFIGVRDDGSVEGVPDPDTLQKTIRAVCDQDCYPAVAVSIEVLNVEGRSVLAVVVPPSTNKPHFTGAAYVRRGAESVAASAEVFDELVHSRNSKCAAIIKLKNKVITVVAIQHRLGATKRVADGAYREGGEAFVEAVDSQTVRLRLLASNRLVTEPLDHVTVAYDEEKHRPMLVVTGY